MFTPNLSVSLCLYPMKISNISSSELLTELLPSEDELYEEDLNYLDDEQDSEPEVAIKVTPKPSKGHSTNLCMNRSRYDHKQSLREGTPIQTQECSICFELSDEQKLYVVEGCCHIFCSECLYSYLDITTKDSSLLRHNVCFYQKLGERTLEISSSVLFGVKCPQRGCQYLLEYGQIQELSSELAKRFNSFTSQQVVDEESKYFPRCKQCNNASLPLGVTTCEGFFCTICNRKFCQECQLQPHPYYTCETFKAHLAEEAKLLKKKKTKRVLSEAYLKILRDEKFQHWAFGKYATDYGISICPVCHVAIEKNGGCDHMKCKKCNADFSWSKSERVGITLNHWYRPTGHAYGYRKAQQKIEKYISSATSE